ncbi:uncharacterized protein C20orf96 homolog [Apus apus]|uniref:uncharacterized protein C20orf96 homolog n=1 Tax=Apus apus TaxID=8895 RepID=UPI0021F8A06B|nr:uncharacterized protein C20orf96 homolog [Apus apus]
MHRAQPGVPRRSSREDEGRKAEPEERKAPARRSALPRLANEDKEKKKGEKQQPETMSSPEKNGGFSKKKLALRKEELAKNLEEIEIILSLCERKREAIEELQQFCACLEETNCQLVRDIQQADESTAKQATALLQECDKFQRVKETVQITNQKRLKTARAELQEMEKTMEKNVGKLQQSLDEATSKVQVLQEELREMQICRDRQLPEQAARIALLQHSIQSLKEKHQEERDKTEEKQKVILEELEEKAWAELEALVQKIVEETLQHQDGLKQLVINNHILQYKILRQKEVIKDLEEEIGELKRSIQTLQQSVRDSRELLFADVLLPRPKCTPDTEVILTIPTEETQLI